jgi:hypothetical protein
MKNVGETCHVAAEGGGVAEQVFDLQGVLTLEQEIVHGPEACVREVPEREAHGRAPSRGSPNGIVAQRLDRRWTNLELQLQCDAVLARSRQVGVVEPLGCSVRACFVRDAAV